MRNFRTVLLALLLSTAIARAADPALTIVHEGSLLDGLDHPVGETGLAFQFRVYAANVPNSLEGGPLWTGSCPVDVFQGRYAVTLGDGVCGSDLRASVFPSDTPRYLEVSVGGVILLPRLRLGTVPTAAVATNALDAEKLGGEAPATFRDAARLTGIAPASVLGSGSPDLTTVGTIASGVWQGAAVADAFVASAATWNGKLATVTRDGTLVGEGTSLSSLGVNVGTAAGSVAAGDDARFLRWSGTSTGLDAAVARTSLGLGTAATTSASAYATAAQGSKADAALAQSGGTLTGALSLASSLPTDALHAASKGYVDARAKAALAGQILYEAEDLYSQGSDVATDTTASGGKVRQASTGGCLVYGPYTVDQPPGHYRALFRMKGSGKATIDQVVSALGGATNDNVTSSKTVTARASWAEFALKFTRGSAGIMEYRVCGAGPNVVVDYVRILRDESAGSRPKLMPSVNAYTIAEAIAAVGDTWPGGAGDGTICESGYHACNFLEAITLKYTVDEVYGWGNEYLRTTGNFSWVPYTSTTHPHHSLLGYNDGGSWTGPSLACPVGSGPMVYFEGNARAASPSAGHSWTGGCHVDERYRWACCLNLPEY